MLISAIIIRQTPKCSPKITRAGKDKTLFATVKIFFRKKTKLISKSQFKYLMVQLFLKRQA
jgi:hypothetical protein